MKSHNNSDGNESNKKPHARDSSILAAHHRDGRLLCVWAVIVVVLRPVAR